MHVEILGKVLQDDTHMDSNNGKKKVDQKDKTYLYATVIKTKLYSKTIFISNLGFPVQLVGRLLEQVLSLATDLQKSANSRKDDRSPFTGIKASEYSLHLFIRHSFEPLPLGSYKETSDWNEQTVIQLRPM